MQLDEKNLSSESRRFNMKKGIKGVNALPGHQKFQVPSSSSEPTLGQTSPAIGPSLRETSSWSNPSDSTHISQHKNIQFNVVDAMNPVGDLKDKKTAGRKEVNLDKLREEFRGLIIPLMQKVVNENPSDLIAYCAQYFQDLLAVREEEKISNCKLLDDVNGEKDRGYPEDQIVKSSSLPTLFQMNDSFGPLLFENVSWNSKYNAPWTVQSTSNLKAVEKKIRDQIDKKEKFCNKEDGTLLKEDDDRKSKNKIHHRSSDRKSKEKETDLNKGGKSPKHENTKSDINVLSKPSNLRKKWLEPETPVKNKITNSPNSSGSDSNSSDSDDFDSSYTRFQNEDTIPLNPKDDSISDSYHEHGLSDERNGTKSDNTCHKRKSCPSEKQELSVEEVESFANCLFQTLKNHIQLAEVEIKEKIQQIKSAKCNASGNSHSQLLPRKKRSITTLDSTSKEGHKDSSAKYSGSDPDLQKGLSKKERDPRRNFKSKADAEEDVKSHRQKNTERCREDGNKNTHGGCSVMEGFTNPAFSLEQETINSNNSIFMRPRKHEWIQPSATDLSQHSRNVRTNLPPVRSSCIRPVSTYPSSSRFPMRPQANSIISNIGDGDVLSLNQNVCSIAIETDNPITIERSAGSNNRIRPNRNNDGKKFHDASKKEERDKASKRGENNQKISTGLKGSCSKKPCTKNTDTKAAGGGQLEKSQSTAEEINRPSATNSFEKKLSDLDLERVKTSNLNPCAPVFSPNSSRFVPITNEATNANTTTNSVDGRKKWDRTPRLDIALLTDTDLSIDAVAWDCLRTRNPQTLEDNGDQELPFRDCGRGVREFESTPNGPTDDSNSYDESETRNTKMVEGDRTSSTTQGDKDRKSDGVQAEPSLNPACGDFVLSEDNREKPLQNGTVEENSNSLSSSGSDDSAEIKDKIEESERLDDEGLNFACLSDSGSSEEYSSELSEEEEEYEEEI